MGVPMAVSALGVTIPYLTVAELKRSPISTQLRKLVPNSSDADTDAELGQIIKRVSALINGEANQNLAATTDTEVGWVVVDDYGELRIHTRCDPIVEVLSVSVGRDATSLSPLTDLSSVVLDPWRITIPQASGLMASGLNLPLGYGRRGRRLFAEWTYVNGYPVTMLSAASSVGATTITVADATGIQAGRTELSIEDGKWLEMVTPSAVNGNVLTVPALAFAHQVGVGVTALPDDIKETALLLISRLHDSWSLSMGAITHDGSGARKPGSGPARALCDAAVMLAPYRRVW